VICQQTPRPPSTEHERTLHRPARPSETPHSRCTNHQATRCLPGNPPLTLETPLGRCCHTDPAKHHPSSGTTEKG